MMKSTGRSIRILSLILGLVMISTLWLIGTQNVEAQTVGRTAALRFLQQIYENRPNTLGNVVFRAVRPVVPLVGDLFSDNIGGHYQEPPTRTYLDQPPTDYNINQFAVRETNFWLNNPDPNARIIGSILSANARTRILTCFRGQNNTSFTNTSSTNTSSTNSCSTCYDSPSTDKNKCPKQ